MSEVYTPSTMAERAVIGDILNDNSVVGIARSMLKEEDFFSEANRRLFGAICKLDDDRKPINVATLFSMIGNDPSFANAGGVFYITECSNQAVTSASIESDAKIVHDDSVRRKLSSLADGLKSMMEAGVDNIEEVLSSVSSEIMALGASTNVTPWTVFNDSLESVCKELASDEPVNAIKTGFIDLDSKLVGLKPGTLTIIAARPAMGKTALGLNILANVGIDQDLPCAMFSLEMTADELTNRIISSRAKVNSTAMRKKVLSDDEWESIVRVVDKTQTSKIYIDETPGIDIRVLSDRAKRMHAQYGIRLIIVDYLQLMTSNSKRAQNREQEISIISRGLKALAKELKIPVIAIAQLSRGVESRADKRPLLSDLRESGSIEQDADVVTFIYREDYYQPNAEPNNTAEVIIAKHRGGPTGIVKLHWNGDFTLFSDLEMW